MNHDIELIKITEKFKERCGCYSCESNDILQGYLESFFRVLARLLCWVDGECATILKTHRTEQVPLKDLEVCGCESHIEIKPRFFKGFDPSTLKVYVQCKQGSVREVKEVSQEKWNWSFVDNTLIVDTTEYFNPCCPPCINECCCGAEYKLILDYEAGYTSENMPDCVYDSLCHFMNIFIAYQNQCGSLEDCANMDRLAVGSVLEQKSVDYVVRKWKVDNMSIDRFYLKLIYKWSLQTLSSLSLCNNIYTDNMYVTIGRRKKCK